MNFLSALRHKWSRQEVASSSFWAILFFLFSLVSTYLAGAYAAAKASGKVNDILLDILPVVNVRFVVFQLAIVFIIALAISLILNPHKLPFTLKSLALFTFIRSLFLVMTHLSPYLGIEYQQSFFKAENLVMDFAFGADLFFSGHTGAPFLLALIFWHNIYLRVFFLISSVVSAAAVLLGHLHYSIDVFAAYFITYSIFHLAKRFFKRDHELFMQEPILP